MCYQLYKQWHFDELCERADNTAMQHDFAGAFGRYSPLRCSYQYNIQWKLVR